MDLMELTSDSNSSASTDNSTITLKNILLLLDPANYPSSYKSAETTRNTLIISCYSSLVFVSLFGNLLVCYVILTRKRMQTSVNLLMTNLVISDLLMTVVNIPFNIARLMMNEWPFGPVLCVLVPLIQVTSVYVSTFTMMVIAIDRYQAILNPLHKRITTTLPIIRLFILIWFVSLLLSLPNVSFNRVVTIHGHKALLRCRTVYPGPELTYRRCITLFTFTTQYVLPLTITSFAYVRISVFIWKKIFTPSRRDSNQSINQSNQSNEDMTKRKANNSPSSLTTLKTNTFVIVNTIHKKSRKKTIKMLAIVLAVFAICWLPLNIFHLRLDFSTDGDLFDTNIFFLCHWFAMSSVCYNPFIYFWLNRHYREGIKQILLCEQIKAKSKAKPESGTTQQHRPTVRLSSPNKLHNVRSQSARYADHCSPNTANECPGQRPIVSDGSPSHAFIRGQCSPEAENNWV